MIDWMAVLVACGLLALGFCLALTAYALRDFSRSRLQEICEQQQRESRFSEILQFDELAVVITDLAVLLVVLATPAVFTHYVADGFLESTTGNSVLRAILAGLLAMVTLGFCWIVLPWTVARVSGERWLFRLWPAIRLVLRMVQPLVRLIERIDLVAHRLSGLPEPDSQPANVLTEEIRTVVDEGHREGVLQSEASSMIRRVMEMRDEDVAAIMTPRTDMVAIHIDMPLTQAREIMLDGGYSRVPVIGESTDDVVGILHAKDLLRFISSSEHPEVQLHSILREPFYVPETTSIDTLLETMRRDHVHLAIVLDEYSGVAGLVTMEDILEEIVGDIVDEYDEVEQEGIEVTDSGQILVDGRVHIDDLNERFQFDLPEDGDYDTIGGFVMARFERVPRTSEICRWRHLRITVLEADRRKLHRLQIEADPAATMAADDDG